MLPRAARRSALGELQLTAAQRRCRCSRVLGAESRARGWGRVALRLGVDPIFPCHSSCS